MVLANNVVSRSAAMQLYQSDVPLIIDAAKLRTLCVYDNAPPSSISGTTLYTSIVRRRKETIIICPTLFKFEGRYDRLFITNLVHAASAWPIF